MTFPVCLSLVQSSFLPKITRYPDRSRQQQQQSDGGRSFSNYDPASAFRNSAAAAGAASASADDLYGFAYDPQTPQDRGREGNDGRRRQRPDLDYPRRNASSSGYIHVQNVHFTAQAWHPCKLSTKPLSVCHMSMSIREHP